VALPVSKPAVNIPMSPIAARVARRSDNNRQLSSSSEVTAPSRGSSAAPTSRFSLGENARPASATTKAPLPLYQQQTKSSAAKKGLAGKVAGPPLLVGSKNLQQQTSVENSVPAKRTSFSSQPQQPASKGAAARKLPGRVSLDTKEKFKSTPNLKDAGLGSFDDISNHQRSALRSPKTTDDIHSIVASPRVLPNTDGRTPVRRSMPAAKQPRELPLSGYGRRGIGWSTIAQRQ
jgi:hypothetical protein